ncbi:MAG: peptidylprolyl isomerase [Woeseiaceae bacterium]|nr:peptidylprolyl isomerase [Woeseiaceae bacterium]
MTTSISAGASRANPILRALGASAVLVALAACTSGTNDTQQDAAADGTDGMQVDPGVLNAYMETRLGKPATEATPTELSDMQDQLLDIYALTETPRAKELAQTDEVKSQLELQRRGLLAQSVATDYLEQNPATEEEMRALYDEQTGLAPEEFKARHILVETEEEGIALITELDGGADFAELAQENSTGPSGPSGGDLGWFTPERMVPEFSNAVAALEDGAYSSSPVQTQFGWHVILREESRQSTPPPFESVGEVLKQQVEQRKLQDYIGELRGDSED